MKPCIKNEKTKESPTKLEILNIIDYRSSLEINKKTYPKAIIILMDWQYP